MHVPDTSLLDRNDVCMVGTDQEATLARAGAVAQFLGTRVLFCGGRNEDQVHNNCLQFDPMANEWSEHSTLTR